MDSKVGVDFLLCMCPAIFDSVNLMQDINSRIHNDSELVHDTLTKLCRERNSQYAVTFLLKVTF